jgi:hypothetical protein
MSTNSIREQTMLALDRMFDEACEEDSEYESYFAGYTGIHFDKATGLLRLVSEDGTENTLTVVIEPGTKTVPEPIPKGKKPFPCPNCGGKSMATVDDVLAFREVHRFVKTKSDEDIIGTLITDATDDYSDGDNTRLCCNGCGACYEIPVNIEIDWED